MIGLDTNVLVRYITQDGPEAEVVTRYLEANCTSDNPGFLSVICLVELVWVLNRAYAYRREQIADILNRLIETHPFEIESVEMVWRALHDYRTGQADFSDYLMGHISKHQGAHPVLTLDRKASKSKLFRLL